jgi:thiol:disulfide interchange protein
MARTDWTRSSQRWLPLWLPIVAAVLIVARIVSSRYDVTSTADLVRWVPLDRAERMAAMSHRPVFYEFSAEWCGPCHLMESEVFRNARLAAMINERFIPVRVVDRKREDGRNAPEVARLQTLYGVEGFPTIVVARAGAAPQKVFGYGGRAQFEQFLDGIH